MSTVEAPAERKTKRAHRSPNGPGLYITDAELVEMLGVPEDVARTAIAAFDRLPSGFPKKQPMFGNRRYWPSVKAFLDKYNGVQNAEDARKGAERDRLPSRAIVRDGK